MEVTFSLGQGSSKISHRAVKIIRVDVVPHVTVYESNLAGTTEECSCPICEVGAA